MKNENILILFNEKLGTNFSTKEELTNHLSNLFEEKMEDYEDAQEAFDSLNDDIGGNLLSNECCYSLSDGGSWEVNCERVTNEMLATFRLIGWNVDTIDDLVAVISSKVEDTMGNVGCDVKTALSLEFEDFPSDYEWHNLIFIDVPEGNPCIGFVDDII